MSVIPTFSTPNRMWISDITLSVFKDDEQIKFSNIFNDGNLKIDWV